MLNPIDEQDANAKKHDLAYDKSKAAGKFDAFFNENTKKADDDLIKASDKYRERYKKGDIDKITKKPITTEANKAAWRAKWLFKTIRKTTK